ncbi:conserved hypothetical protein [Ruegeria lacuscaerulensis ITI-1157]|nr:conserved hypothetical protein [Ruegeria lacuscaerulensis ITI-1157]SHI46680.1 hypothetical protein SAMN05444404_0308 [Ruegeria lacuscaerulensis ITI-1157]
MEVILHCGAHRCATTSFQGYMTENAQSLEHLGLVYWGPERARSIGLNNLDKLTPEVCAGLQRDLDACMHRGARAVLISQENFVGSMVRNFACASLYPNARERGYLLAKAFGGRVSKIALNIRSLDMYWASAAAYLFKRRNKSFEPERWSRIANGNRSWRDVIMDFSGAFPGTAFQVFPFEEFCGQQRAQLEILTGLAVPDTGKSYALNGTSRPAPHGLNAQQSMKLSIEYAYDLAWLAAGADGLAELVSHTGTHDRGIAPEETGFEQRKST